MKNPNLPLLRRSALALAGAALFTLASLAAAPAFAETWPSKPVKLVVPFPPGGGNDIFARELAQELQKKLGQPFVVDNRGGASGNIGINAVAKSPADGYTLLVVSNTLVTNPALSSQLPYDVYKDFEPITLAANLPVVLVTSLEVVPKTLPALVFYAKANPGKLTYGSAGIGAPHHLTTEYFSSQAGVNLLHVPFKGQGQIVPEIVAGRVDMAFLAISSVTQFLATNRVRGIATAGAKRTPLAPDLPTLTEAGLPGTSIDWWLGVLAPAGTPKDIVTRLNAEIVALCKQPEFRARLAAQGIDAVGSTPQAFAKVLRDEIPRWTQVVKTAGIKAE
ncbi:MAG: tripartite tricarboxylate transporter substrate binding protein [Polaromonas sp.]|nr:tripartite tricarboxylate transporter substrate binding protein [Polaromonas sp.]